MKYLHGFSMVVISLAVVFGVAALMAAITGTPISQHLESAYLGGLIGLAWSSGVELGR